MFNTLHYHGLFEKKPNDILKYYMNMNNLVSMELQAAKELHFESESAWNKEIQKRISKLKSRLKMKSNKQVL